MLVYTTSMIRQVLRELSIEGAWIVHKAVLKDELIDYQDGIHCLTVLLEDARQILLSTGDPLYKLQLQTKEYLATSLNFLISQAKPLGFGEKVVL